MTAAALRHRLAVNAFWALVIVVVFALFLAASHLMVGTGEVTSTRLVFERKTLASHQDECYADEPCYDEGYDQRGDGGDQEYDQWNSDQRNHNRRNRGAFSPGPFDRSPIEMHDVCISLDCSDGKKDDRKQPPERRNASLTDPTKLPQAITAIIKAGLDMGQLFADGTFKFIESLFTALA